MCRVTADLRQYEAEQDYGFCELCEQTLPVEYFDGEFCDQCAADPIDEDTEIHNGYLVNAGGQVELRG